MKANSTRFIFGKPLSHFILGTLCLCLLPVLLHAAEPASPSGGHGDPFAMIFEVFVVLLICAIVGRYGARKLKQSPVLGELVIGIIIGAIMYQFAAPTVTIIRHSDLIGQATTRALNEKITMPEAVRANLKKANLPEEQAYKIEQVILRPDFPDKLLLARAIQLFSSLGVILLLFMVGLECSLEEMAAVGGRATGVALIGMVAPFVLGFMATKLLYQGADPNLPIFVGATLSATSIGITSRVFKDMNRLDLGEAKIVLGAAVIDDVLGLIVLALVTGIATSGQIAFSGVGLILLKAALFLGGVIFFGLVFLKKQIAFFARMDQSNIRLLYPFGLLLLFSWLADTMGLATIVGAFAAGLIIKEEYFPTTELCHYEGQEIHMILAPLEGVFAPVFFVLMGLQVDVTTFLTPQVLITGFVLTLAAILGKLAASLWLGPGEDKFIVGFGLNPRGEVGLIFASIGKAIGVLDSNWFSAIIVVVLLTTLMTPPSLKWAIERRDRGQWRDKIT
jgi:Kef-type K+ transport system membrane component KefB